MFHVGDPVYALYFGPRRDNDGRWVPALVTKRKGSRTFNVKVQPNGPTWRRHSEQLQPRAVSDEDDEPETLPVGFSSDTTHESATSGAVESSIESMEVTNSFAAKSPEFGPDNPRRSKRVRKPVRRYSP